MGYSNDYLIKITQIQRNKIDLSKALTIKKSNQFKKYRVVINDLLIALSGATSGKTGIYNLKENSFLNQRVAKIESKKYSIKYLNYFFSLSSLTKQMYIESNITAQPNFTNKILDIYNINISKLEQNKIVSYLDKKTSQFKSQVSNIDKEIELLEEFRKTTINEVVTGKIKVVK